MKLVSRVWKNNNSGTHFTSHERFICYFMMEIRSWSNRISINKTSNFPILGYEIIWTYRFSKSKGTRFRKKTNLAETLNSNEIVIFFHISKIDKDGNVKSAATFLKVNFLFLTRFLLRVTRPFYLWPDLFNRDIGFFFKVIRLFIATRLF